MRLRELALKADNHRLEQELVLLAQKLDVAEEMDRLDLHLDEFSRVLNRPGRRLDFLRQDNEPRGKHARLKIGAHQHQRRSESAHRTDSEC